MNKKQWAIFVALQVIGEICYWNWPRLPSVADWMWGAGFIFLLPGNILGAVIVESLLRGHGLGLLQLGIIEIPIEILINWGICILLIKAWRLARRSVP